MWQELYFYLAFHIHQSVETPELHDTPRQDGLKRVAFIHPPPTAPTLGSEPCGSFARLNPPCPVHYRFTQDGGNLGSLLTAPKDHPSGWFCKAAADQLCNCSPSAVPVRVARRQGPGELCRTCTRAGGGSPGSPAREALAQQGSLLPQRLALLGPGQATGAAGRREEKLRP